MYQTDLDNINVQLQHIIGQNNMLFGLGVIIAALCITQLIFTWKASKDKQKGK